MWEKCRAKENKVTGTGTAFSTDFKAGDQIVVCGQTVKVSSIESDEQLTVEPPFETSVGEPSAFTVIPKLDQSKVYDEVWGTLNDGNAIAIFPEGGSHDRTELLPLKAGVSLMALGAMNKFKGMKVKIVPCGLNYLHAHKFRSTAFVEYGKPIEISQELVDKYNVDKRGACGELLNQVPRCYALCGNQCAGLSYSSGYSYCSKIVHP